MSRRLFIAVFAALLTLGALPAAGAKVISKHPKDLAMVTRVFYSHRGGESKPKLIGKCPTASTCDAFKLGRARWAVTALPYYYSDEGRPDDAPGADASRAALARAISAWDSRNPAISFVSKGATTARPTARAAGASCGDGVNTVGWKNLGGSALGLTVLCYERKTKTIIEADLAVNSSVDWGILAGAVRPSTEYDLQSVYTHELGHWFSLLDLYGRRQISQTMYGSAQPGEINKRTLALGDVLGFQKAYPCGGCTPGSFVAD